MAPKESERIGGVVAVGAAVPLAYLTLAARKKALHHVGQTRSGLVEDVLIVCGAFGVVMWATRKR